MGLKLYDETSVQAIADAIRAKNGSSDTYTISEMSTAIEDIPSGGGGGTHTETKTVTFLNTTTPFNVGEDFLSGYGVYPQDSSYALAIAVSDGVGFAARLHNGVVDGYSGSCTYSNGVFTFDSTFVLNYMGNSVYSLDCLFSNGDLYKYHWSNDRTICVREGVGEVKWFFKGYASPGQYARPEELAQFFPPVGNTPILGPAYSTSDATEQVGWIGFYQYYIRTWSMSTATLISGNFYGVVNATDYYTLEQHEVYTDPLDIPDIDISLIEKTITQNGTYSAEDDGYVGYSDVTINIPSSAVVKVNKYAIVNNGVLQSVPVTFEQGKYYAAFYYDDYLYPRSGTPNKLACFVFTRSKTGTTVEQVLMNYNSYNTMWYYTDDSLYLNNKIDNDTVNAYVTIIEIDPSVTNPLIPS